MVDLVGKLCGRRQVVCLVLDWLAGFSHEELEKGKLGIVYLVVTLIIF